MSFESTAATIIQRGVLLDKQKRYTESLICYQEGVQILIDVMKNAAPDKKAYLRGKIEEYISRAEQIKGNIEQLKEEGKYHEQVNIENNGKGYSYETVFGRFLDDDVLSVKVEDPYIRSFHQCQNFVKFCELIVKKCKMVHLINLLTTRDPNNFEQEKWLNELQKDLANYKIKLKIEYSPTLHDRQITLSSGWIIKIGRGLDYFKAPDGKFCIGAFHMDLRSCHETSIDIFHNNNVKQSS